MSNGAHLLASPNGTAANADRVIHPWSSELRIAPVSGLLHSDSLPPASAFVSPGSVRRQPGFSPSQYHHQRRQNLQSGWPSPWESHQRAVAAAALTSLRNQQGPWARPVDNSMAHLVSPQSIGLTRSFGLCSPGAGGPSAFVSPTNRTTSQLSGSQPNSCIPPTSFGSLNSPPSSQGLLACKAPVSLNDLDSPLLTSNSLSVIQMSQTSSADTDSTTRPSFSGPATTVSCQASTLPPIGITPTFVSSLEINMMESSKSSTTPSAPESSLESEPMETTTTSSTVVTIAEHITSESVDVAPISTVTSLPGITTQTVQGLEALEKSIARLHGADSTISPVASLPSNTAIAASTIFTYQTASDHNMEAARRMEARIAMESQARAANAENQAQSLSVSEDSHSAPSSMVSPQMRPSGSRSGSFSGFLTQAATGSVSFPRPLSSTGPQVPGIPDVTVMKQDGMYTCTICGFRCPSKFHFNSHMNTHFDHQCKYCDYTARTEGRLKQHMRTSHTYPVAPPMTSEAQADTVSSTINGSAGEGNDDSMGELPITTTALAILPPTSPYKAMSGSDDSNGDLSLLLPGTVKCPTVSSKPKTYRCKQCPYIAHSKDDSYLHARTHIKKDKQLSCPKCLFVTEYKHHLEYHLRNHYGSKPFKCTKCNYSCVNKSMLNSHMKSHSNFYQYRCADCTYATKYCHSLKLHLRKYNHHAATVVGQDGSIIDATTIDVYGGRRGPRSRPPGLATGYPPTSRSQVLDQLSQLPLGPAGLLSQFHGLFNKHTNGTSSYPPHPRLSNGMGPPVSLMSNSIAPLGATLPTIPSSSYELPSPVRPKALMPPGGFHSPPGPFPMANDVSASLTKCSLCDFVGDNREQKKHMVTHLIEDDIADLYPPTSSQGAPGHPPGEMNGFVSEDSPRRDADTVIRSTASAQGEEQSGPLIIDERDVNSESPTAKDSPHTRSDRTEDTESPHSTDDHKETSPDGHEVAAAPNSLLGSSRRKGKAHRLDRICRTLQKSSVVVSVDEGGSSEDVDAMRSPLTSPVMNIESNAVGQENVVNIMMTESAARSVQMGSPPTGTETPCIEGPQSVDWSRAYVCAHCQIAFRDPVMYQLHKGYHGFEDPYRCNMCGQSCVNPMGLFLHMTKDPHPW